MQLKNEEKKKLRKKYEEELALVPEGEKIKLPKKELEQLLFEVRRGVREDDPKAQILDVKFLVWSGNFLSKVDLSEVSFENVSWNVGGGNATFKVIDPSTPDYIIIYYGYGANDVKKICLTNTNAKIDFSKSAECKIFGRPEIVSCDFTGTDLSNNQLNLSRPILILDSKFDGTSIMVTDTESKFSDHEGAKIGYSSFRGVDFSKVVIDIKAFYTTYGDTGGLFGENNFTNTGLRIISSYKMPAAHIKDFCQKNQRFFPNLNDGPNLFEFDHYSSCKDIPRNESEKTSQELDILYGNYFGPLEEYYKYLNKGLLCGCYVDGRRILTPQEQLVKIILENGPQILETPEVVEILGGRNTYKHT